MEVAAAVRFGHRRQLRQPRGHGEKHRAKLLVPPEQGAVRLGTVVDVKAKQLAEDAWKKAEDRITGLERNERLAFSQRLAALGKTLWNLEANPIVEDEGVKGALDGLRGSLERAVAGTDDAAARGRASADIQGYAQNLSVAMTASSANGSDLRPRRPRAAPPRFTPRLRTASTSSRPRLMPCK